MKKLLPNNDFSVALTYLWQNFLEDSNRYFLWDGICSEQIWCISQQQWWGISSCIYYETLVPLHIDSWMIPTKNLHQNEVGIPAVLKIH